MNTDGMKKLQRLFHIIRLFQNTRRGYRTREIADMLGINEDTAGKYLNELSGAGLLPVTKDGHVWILPEGATIPHLELSLSYPEAVSLYLAGRLLSQTQDEQNWHVTMALKKLVEALPASLKERQQTLLDALLFMEHPNEQLRDMSHIFQVLASGWVTQRRVRLSYSPPSRKSFECFFDPYLLEPSAIGRTKYAIGYSSVVNDIRTYKLERIQQAELTSEPFTVSEKFKGPEMLQQAWGVMYGDEEPVKVRLRFSAAVTPRVRETRWHPSQELMLTRDGCEWTAIIGETLEIEPWIRGWGGDCEVLEPAALRERMLIHVRQMVENYQLTPAKPRNPIKFDDTLFRAKES
ncbi:MAG TPA: WYL domain-containing transcriptional regulator [Ktedonobacteraceae bacterium]|nr:WYL domain-containing transcriptional regulator [Ktedonobacteraceae bacterium]